MQPTTWLFDLDGVLWLGDLPVDGAAAALDRLRAAGHRVGFCTNNSYQPIGAYLAKLGGHGVAAAAGEVLTSAVAVSALVTPGESVLVCAGPGVVEAVQSVGCRLVEHGTADVVVVGFHRDFDYDAMAAATTAVLGGARLIATNDDPIYPAADGPLPGCGAILASIERATGQRAVVAGKPNPPMVDLVRRRFGDGVLPARPGAGPARPDSGVPGVFVGDTLRTDGDLAVALGWQFGLVLTGNTTAASVPHDLPAEWVAPDVATLIDRHLA